MGKLTAMKRVISQHPLSDFYSLVDYEFVQVTSSIANFIGGSRKLLIGSF